jgi:hypothetical protein
MNSQLEKFARATLKNGLSQCTDAQKMIFKRMYANGKLDLPIDDVVDAMPADKLDWAMQQVERSLSKNASSP